jgi:hypothetical protein
MNMKIKKIKDEIQRVRENEENKVELKQKGTKYDSKNIFRR